LSTSRFQVLFDGHEFPTAFPRWAVVSETASLTLGPFAARSRMPGTMPLWISLFFRRGDMPMPWDRGEEGYGLLTAGRLSIGFAHAHENDIRDEAAAFLEKVILLEDFVRAEIPEKGPTGRCGRRRSHRAAHLARKAGRFFDLRHSSGGRIPPRPLII